MKTIKKVLGIYHDIMREAYQSAYPSADWDKLIKTKEVKTPNWFKKYYLSPSKLDEIFNKHTENKKLAKHELNSLSFEVYLGCSPTSNLDTWVNERDKLIRKVFKDEENRVKSELAQIKTRKLSKRLIDYLQEEEDLRKELN